MGVLFIFISISVLVVSALLFFNKGEKAQEIKSILTDIYKNFKDLFSNLKKLFLILKDLIQTKLGSEPTQLNNESSSDDSPKLDTSNETESVLSQDLATTSEDSNTDLTESKTEEINEPESIPPIEIDTPSNDSTNEKDNDTKMIDF